MRLTLTVTKGPELGRAFTFEHHNTFFVGRSPDAHFRLPEDDPYVSRLQFMVEINPPLCRLVDMKSRNGTLVNAKRVAMTDLHDGDEIQAGRTTLQVALQQPAVPGVGHTLALEQELPLAEFTKSPPAPLEGSYPPTVAPLDPAGSSGVGRWLQENVMDATGAQGAGPRTPPLEQPPSIPGYRMVRELGRGGMGVVYEAVREADGSRVALKTVLPAVKPTEKEVRRFLREAEVLRQLEHPHIIGFREMGEGNGLLFFAMDFIDGSDAARILKAEGPLAVGRAVAWSCQMLDALAYAHGRGFVHRDIKPANLLIAREDGREVVMLADFGLARTYQASALSGLTVTGAVAGTPAFMPPEQILDFHSVLPAGDQYSAAAALYNLLTACPLYDGTASSMDLFLKILQEEPVPLRKRRPELPAALVAAIHRGLARKPEERFPDASAFRQALLPFAD